LLRLLRKIFKSLISLIRRMNPTLKDIKDTEFNRIHYNTLSDNYFEIIEGRIPVLLSAPHGAKHLRNGEWKEEDEYTPSIAIKLGELTGANVIFVRNKTKEDSNFLKKTRYKDAIKKLVQEKGIRFVVDIHGASEKHGFNICVGTRSNKKDESSCPSYIGIIENVLEDFQKDHLFNRQHFKAEGEGTITTFACKVCKIEAAQFEISAKYRIIERKPDSSKAIERVDPDFKAKEEDVLKLVKLLVKLINEINQGLVRIGQ